jgi:hypothetical protein
MVDEDQWIRAVKKLRKVLEAIDRAYKDGRDQAILAVWKTLGKAPSTSQQIYGEWPESELRARARGARAKLKEPAFGFELSSGDPDEILKSLAALLRALEMEHSSFDNASLPTDPASWIVELSGEKFYLIPIERVPWEPKPAPDQDFRPFLQRGLLSFRVIPLDVDGAKVTLWRVRRLVNWTVPQFFGAALLPDVEFSRDESQPGTFIMTKAECERRPEIISYALKETFLSHCIATVFPELTIADAARRQIRTLLASRPWEEEPDGKSRKPQTPALVVAGSWHRSVKGGHANIAPVFDGDGNPLFEHHKRMKFKLKRGSKAKGHLVERIVPGQKVHVAVLDKCLIAIAICLDFADLKHPGKIYNSLDVDLVLVPSCGNDQTMRGHLDTARTFEIQRKSRTFVVQQAYPKRREGIGFVLCPKKEVPETVNETVKAAAWTCVST